MIESRRERTSLTLETPRWTEVPRGAGAALRPARFVVALLAAVVICVLTQAPLPWLEGKPTLAALWVTPGFESEPKRSFMAAARLVAYAPWTAALMGLLILTPLAFAMTAIGRSVAVERATGRMMSTGESVGFAVSRLASMAVAFLLPAGLVTVMLVAMAAAGAGLLRFGGVNVVGAVVYWVAVLVAVPMALLVAVLFVAWPMIPGALAAEGTGSGKHGRGDGIDALSRVIAYVVNAPLWFALYGAIGALAVRAMAWVGGEVAGLAVGMARGGMTWWLPEKAARDLEPGASAEGTAAAAQTMMAWGDMVPWTIAVGATIAVASGAAMMVYLMVRYRCDGQHPHDIWVRGPEIAAETPASAAGAESDDE